MTPSLEVYREAQREVARLDKMIFALQNTIESQIMTIEDRDKEVHKLRKELEDLKTPETEG